MELHENIYRLRMARGMSQAELAESLEVSRQSISKWETGAAVPELEKLMRLSDVFGVTLDELVRGEAKAGEGAAEVRDEPQPTVIIERRGMETHRIIALVALCMVVLLTFLAAQIGSPRGAVVLGLPLVAVCVLFLALPRRHLLWGFWILWLLALLSMWKLTGGYFLSANVGNMVGTVVSLPLVAGLVALIVATVRRLKK